MSLKDFLQKLESAPESISFADTMGVIEQYYDYTPGSFTNGIGADSVRNEAGSNEGSCKIFAFAELNGLDDELTLNCFGDYYRLDVLQHPEATDHANIRTFMRHGWKGISFDHPPLRPKAANA